jgi:hypothetical protein
MAGKDYIPDWLKTFIGAKGEHAPIVKDYGFKLPSELLSSKIDEGLARRLTESDIEQIAFDACNRLNFNDFPAVNKVAGPNDESPFPRLIYMVLSKIIAEFEEHKGTYAVLAVGGQREPYFISEVKNLEAKGLEYYKTNSPLYRRADIIQLDAINKMRLDIYNDIMHRRLIDFVFKKNGITERIDTLTDEEKPAVIEEYKKQAIAILNNKGGLIDSKDSIEFGGMNTSIIDEFIKRTEIIDGDKARILAIPQSILYGLKNSGLNSSNQEDTRRYNTKLDSINTTFTIPILESLNIKWQKRIDLDRLDMFDQWSNLLLSTAAADPVLDAAARKLMKEWLND